MKHAIRLALTGLLAAAAVGAILLNLAGGTSPDPVQHPSSAPPNTPAAHLGEQFLAALNAGQPQALEGFLDAHLSREPWNRMTREKYSHQLRRLQEQSQGLDCKRIFMSNPTTACLFTSSHAGHHAVGIEVVQDPTDPARVVFIGLHPMPAPVRSAALQSTSAKSPQEQLTAIGALISDTAKRGEFSGSVLLAHGTNILLNQAWGKVRDDQNAPLRPDTLYDTASLGKMFTAVAIAQLVEQGKLSYTDTIGKWLPDYPNPEAAAKVTLHHLLTHTSGVADPFDSPLLARSASFKTEADWFVTFAAKPLRFTPGDHHDYSNGGYLVLAAIVEKASGMRFADYLRRHVFGPAGMTHTGALPAGTRATVAVPHSHPELEDPLQLEPRRPRIASTAGGHSGDLWSSPDPVLPYAPHDGHGMGMWTSSTEDLFRFGRALRDGRLLSPPSLSLLTSGKVSVMFGTPARYGYGFYIVPVGADRMVGHSGGGGDLGIGAEFELLWNTDYTLVILGNCDLPQTQMLAQTIARFLARPPARHSSLAYR